MFKEIGVEVRFSFDYERKLSGKNVSMLEKPGLLATSWRPDATVHCRRPIVRADAEAHVLALWIRLLISVAAAVRYKRFISRSKEIFVLY